MFSHDCSVNQSDNSNEKSQRDDNRSKLSLALENASRSSKRKQQSSLRKYKSESNVCEMGSRLSRSKSLESVEIDRVAYESLKRKRAASLVSAESEDDYKLLESSEVDSEADDNNYASSTIENDSKAKGDHDSAENSGSNMIVNCINRDGGNEIKNELLCKKSSTLPRVKLKNGNVDHEKFVRHSAPYKSLDNRTHRLNKNIRDEELAIVGGETITESDKASSDFEAFRSTTLPKTRPRCKPFFRHSLRRAIDSTMHSRHSRISDASEHSAPIIPATSSSGIDSDSKVRRTRGNLSWLRKSMRKLNPFQMPQVHVEQNIPVASTSEMNACGSKQLLVEPTQDSQTESDEIFQPCSSNPDLFNIVLTEQQRNSDLNRPRQYGRRSNPVRISSFEIESSNNGSARIIAHHQQERRPASAPVQRLHNIAAAAPSSVHRSRACLPSEPSSMASSRNSSPVSIVSSTGSSSVADPISEPQFLSAGRNSDEGDAGEGADDLKALWPHSLSRPICCMFCTLGLFNISRFAIFSVHFGANFLVQFLILSFIFGIPLLWLLMVLGQKIQGGIVTMFKVTPICKGIGVSLMIAHCVISLYSSVSIAWLLIYLKDAVISSDSKYLWMERFDSYRSFQNISALRLSENIADYFNGVVLQRLSGVNHDGKMRFQLAFNVSLVWILVFILLCRGIRSLGRIIFPLAALAFLGLSSVCIKFLTLLSFETIQDIFPATDWQEFFGNSNSWSVAAQEAFLTWGLLGVSIYAMYCKTGKNQKLNPYVLRREALLVVFLTLFGLFLGAVLGSTCIIILKLNGFNYFPASFENPKNDIFLWPSQHSIPPSFHHSIPSKWITRYSNIIGESFERPVFVNQQGVQIYKESGYKALRLVTEMLPATLAISLRIGPVWGVIAFGSLFFFGLAQLGVMWKPISGAIGNSTSAILLSCITGLFLGFPLTTDNGIVILNFLDFIFGGAWWLLILWMSFIVAIFMVRGRPFTSDVLVKDLRFTETLSAFLAFSWNVLLPLALILLSVMEYKKSHSNELFHQRSIPSLNHLASWPTWAKQLGGFLQLALLILVPCFSLVQIYIYLTKGPPDILERIELLFRPPMEAPDPSLNHLPIRRLCQQTTQPLPIIVPLSNTNVVDENLDAPPKYSPPPSYGKAVGLRVAKALRNSIRRSVRRFRRTNEPSLNLIESNHQNIPTVSYSVENRQQIISTVPPCAQTLRINSQTVNRNINEYIRSTMQGTHRSSQSVEHLMMDSYCPRLDVEAEIRNQSATRNVAVDDLI